MNKNLKYLAGYIATAGLSAKEISALYDDILLLGPEGLAKLAKTANRALSDIEESFYSGAVYSNFDNKIAAKSDSYFDSKNNPIKPRSSSPKNNDEIYSRIEKILLSDFGLSSQRAANLFANELEKKSGLFGTTIAPSYRGNLKELIKRISGIYSDKELLEIAFLVRNNESKNPKRDWNINAEDL